MPSVGSQESGTPILIEFAKAKFDRVKSAIAAPMLAMIATVVMTAKATIMGMAVLSCDGRGRSAGCGTPRPLGKTTSRTPVLTRGWVRSSSRALLACFGRQSGVSGQALTATLHWW
jgi:hypothetical protein